MSHVATIGVLENASSTAANTWTITLTAGCAVGQTMILPVGARNNSGEDASFAATDSAGNTWTEGIHVGLSGNDQESILYTTATHAIASGGTITLTHGGINTASVAATVEVFDDVVGIDVMMQASSSPLVTTMSSGVTGVGSQANELIFCGFSWKITSKTFTPATGFTASTVRQSSVSGSTYRNVAAMWQYNTTVGTRSGTAAIDAAGSSYVGAVLVFTTATPAQSAGPVSDITVTGWSTTSGGSVASVTDETTPDFTDYAYTTANPTGVILEDKSGNLGIPTTPALTVTLGLRVVNASSNSQVVDIYCGATLIATFDAIEVTASWDLYDFVLSPTQAANVTDWNNLRYRLHATAAA